MTLNILTVEDIQAIEKTPIEQRLPGNTGYHALCKIAAQQAGKTAITTLVKGEPLLEESDFSYQALLGEVRKAANLLLGQGLEPDQAVTHLLPLIPEAFFLELAAETVAIVNPVNPMLEIDHLVSITKSANTKVLVIPGKDLNAVIFNKGIAVAKANPNIQSVLIVGDDTDCNGSTVLSWNQLISHQNGQAIEGATKDKPDDIIAYFHTGGTTGAPKLACHTNRMRVAQIISTGLMMNYSNTDSIILGLPPFHVAGSIILGLIPLFRGSRVVLFSPEGYRDRESLKKFWQMIEAQKITVLMVVPTVLSGLQNVPVANADLSSLRRILTGGSAVPTELLKSASEQIGQEVGQGFGMTEIGGMGLIQTLVKADMRGSTGIRCPYVEVMIGRESSDGQIEGIATSNEIGMLCFKGPCVMPRYAEGRAQQESFTDEGWFISGDLARMDALGQVWITGRSKDVIIRGGHNIDPMLIEDSLQHHPAVELVAAVGRPDAYAGEMPVAYVQLKPNFTVSAQELLDFSKECISEHVAIPDEIFLIDDMPKTGIDKVFKPALRKDAIKRTIAHLCSTHPEISVCTEIFVNQDSKKGLVTTVILIGVLDYEQENVVRAALKKLPINFELVWK